jgi:uncharacterized protein DUF4231
LDRALIFNAIHSRGNSAMPVSSTGTTSPPRADLAFRVGIVGHRPNRLPKEPEKIDALRGMLRAVLQEVRAEMLRYAASPESKRHYARNPPILRAVAPLAEGTDRMFAEEALDLGYSLCCPMPFGQEEFEKDFTGDKALEPHSVDRFRGILQHAREGAGLTTFELDGERSAEGEAYGAAGRIVLNQSDLLVAVWDGKPAAGKGGTVDTLKDAVRYHVPVLWIDATEPSAWQLLQTPEDFACLESADRCAPRPAAAADAAEKENRLATTIKTIVNNEIAILEPEPGVHSKPMTQSRPPQYFRERKPCFNFAITWKLFRDLVGSKKKFQRPKIRVADFVEQIGGDWPTREDPPAAEAATADRGASIEREHKPLDVEDWVNRRLRAHYAWSDKRGDLYADAYRSAYVMTYLLSAFAVFVALLPMAAHWEGRAQIACVAIELVMLLVILLLLIVGKLRHWHERWMEYRLLAELIRQIRFLIPLGGGRPFPHLPTYLGVHGNLNQTWMYWHMRAVARATGLPPAKVDHVYVRDCLHYIAKVVGVPDGGQLQFHINTEERSEKIAHRLHLWSTILFGATFCGIALHLALDVSAHRHMLAGLEGHPWLQRWLVLASATLPALGAALAAISNQGEFARLARRSAAMTDGFRRFETQIKDLQSPSTASALKLSQVIPLATKIAEVMVEEVSDWRVVFLDRPQAAA